MTVRQTRNVSLTPELERFVMSMLAHGRYRSASEVIRAALRLLEKSESGPEAVQRLNTGSAGHRAR
ncbi:type II toxin-antitoxin system ParD family antitoxin [Rhizobium sp. 007]|uniref:type II toxin-antitoxin system ParD family antitoxin n=1 Tax=Rhizobium sp. 007 TaxID=2785056 RepID=UPI00188E69C9|nr:type II toxin-antitoxin system ParD family antitoxin [Rhizobium sp. 007]QPB19260.1 type II toxin-antitoxin system ParD family antitoxin [Rhizobium sp. 007]